MPTSTPRVDRARRLRVMCRSLTACMLCLWFVGCAASETRARLDDSIRAYDAGDYREAREQAGSVLAETDSAHRYEAAYIAGLAAYQLEFLDEADRRLSFAVDASDDDIRSRSQAMLGQIRLEQGQYAEAEALLMAAAEELSDDDAREARALAARARARLDGPYQTPGQTQGQAQGVYAMNEASISGGSSSLNRFVLQAGAYRDASRAQAAAKQIQPTATAHDLGSVRIVPTEDHRGQPLYLVRFGGFPTRFDARRARDLIGDLEIIVAQRDS